MPDLKQIMRFGQFVALALAFGHGAAPLAAEPDPAPWEAAIARLDFTTALETLGAAIEANPNAAGPRLARAALHVQMQRPALALADLDALIAADPGQVQALTARAEIHQRQRAWNPALADLDAALALRPDDAGLFARRAGLRAIAGRRDAALADYTAALALTPEDPALMQARDRLTAEIAEARAAKIRFAPEAVMSPEFQVVQGRDTAPHTLHFVHAATDLAGDYAGIDREALTRATKAGVLRIVHLFTYTGDSGSIWGNLTAICAGSQGYEAAHAALASAAGVEALNAAGTGNLTPLETLLGGIAERAGLAPEALGNCALYRSQAARYLADWQTHREAGAWQGINLLDHWPVLVLDGTPLGPRALSDRLAAIAHPGPAAEAGPAETGTADTEPEGTGPAEAGTAETGSDPADGPSPAPSEAPAPAPDPAPNAAPSGPAPGTATPEAPSEAPSQGTGATATEATAEAAAPGASAPQDPATPEAPLFPDRPQPAEGARVPVALRGIYAPSLAACLAYLERIENPGRIDTVLPPANPPATEPDAPLLGTILVTSRRAYLFNILGTECAISGAGAGAGAGGTGTAWQGDFTCASPLAPEARPTLHIAPATADGSAPRISAGFGGEQPVTLRQCRALGQFGRAFAPLWTQDDAACRVSVPLENSRLVFSLDPDGALLVGVTPAQPPQGAENMVLAAAVDGTPPPGGHTGSWDGEAWRLSLGPFEAAAERLGWGMFLDLRSSSGGFEARLPLFGSSAAMKQLRSCAPGAQ